MPAAQRLHRILPAVGGWLLATLPLLATHDGPHLSAPSAPAPATAAPAPAAVALAAREVAAPGASAGARAPRFTPLGAALALSWLEPVAEREWRFVYAVRGADGSWSAVKEIARGEDLVAGGADAPVLAAAADGALVAVWVRRLPAGGGATAIEVARSTDEGVTWQRLGRLHDDETATEHAFAQLVAEADGVRAVWLDGRETLNGGAAALRTATIGAEGVKQGGALDDRVCDCCATAMVSVGGRVVVLYRDRGRDEVRDIAVATPINADVWRRSSLAADGWRIEGCPVNGPAAAVEAEQVWAAWYTEGGGLQRTSAPAATGGPTAEGGSRVRLAVSRDGGHSFEPPVELAAAGALGRVDVVAIAGGAVVSWLAGGAEGPELRLRRIAGDLSLGGVEAGPGPVFGVPRLGRQGDEVLLAFVESSTPERLRVLALDRR
jgi:hypothetical protein